MSSDLPMLENTFYKPIFDDDNNIIGENVFKDTLNVLGYIPVISIISGLVRVIFAAYKPRTSSDDETTKHYSYQLTRGSMEALPLFGINNLAFLICDIFTGVTKKLLEIENNKRQKQMATKNIYKI